MPLTLVVPPAEEPLSLAEAKAHLRVSEDADDLLISALITAAREYAEHATRRSLVTQTWDLTLDAFPACLDLERGPVQTVAEVTYIDEARAEIVLPANVYTVDLASGRMTPRFGQTWPMTLEEPGVVRVRYVAGYGGPETVPEGIKAWMKLRLGALYEHREEVAFLPRGTLAPLPFVDRLLDPYRVSGF